MMSDLYEEMERRRHAFRAWVSDELEGKNVRKWIKADKPRVARIRSAAGYRPAWAVWCLVLVPGVWQPGDYKGKPTAGFMVESFGDAMDWVQWMHKHAFFVKNKDMELDHRNLKDFLQAMRALSNGDKGPLSFGPVAGWCNCQAIPGTVGYPGPWHVYQGEPHYPCSRRSI